jgi:hypothetical protein
VMLAAGTEGAFVSGAERDGAARGAKWAEREARLPARGLRIRVVEYYTEVSRVWVRA